MPKISDIQRAKLMDNRAEWTESICFCVRFQHAEKEIEGQEMTDENSTELKARKTVNERK
jgi:hypothetical protein